jgi:hypothetical protein
MNKMTRKKKKEIRLNLYVDDELDQSIREHAQRDFLRKTTWVTQFLRKSLLKNNTMSNPAEDES